MVDFSKASEEDFSDAINVNEALFEIGLRQDLFNVAKNICLVAGQGGADENKVFSLVI